jgi:predicted Zn-dependent protease
MTAKMALSTCGMAVAALLLTGLGTSRPAQAYALEGPIWGTHKANFSYVVPGTHRVSFSSALKQAMADWNVTSGFKYVPIDRSSAPCDMSGPNGAAMGATACGQAFGSGTLAITFYTYTSAKHFTHAGTVFNSNVNFSVYSGAFKPTTTDFRRVAVHELGHALGMAHENNSSIPAIMAPTVSKIEKPQPDDVRGVRAMYGLPN